MTEIEFRPIEKVVILEEITYENLDDFFATLTMGVQPGIPIVVLWAEGGLPSLTNATFRSHS